MCRDSLLARFQKRKNQHIETEETECAFATKFEKKDIQKSIINYVWEAKQAKATPCINNSTAKNT